MIEKPWKPTKAQLEAAKTKTVDDLIAPNLNVLFVGINPGLYTAAVNHHFGRPGNRFWPALHQGGFTPRLYSPFEEDLLLELGLGITNFVARATATAQELSREEVRAGGRIVEQKLLKFRPRWAAVMGVEAYRTAFDRPLAKVGRQDHVIGRTALWVMPNPSGLNAHYTLPRLAAVMREFRDAVDAAHDTEHPPR